MESQTTKFLEFDVAEESSCSQTIEDDSTVGNGYLYLLPYR